MAMVLQLVVAWHGTPQHTTARRGTPRHVEAHAEACVCYVRCRMHCYVDLIGRRKDGSALALGMERAVARGCGFYILDVLDWNTEHRLV